MRTQQILTADIGGGFRFITAPPAIFIKMLCQAVCHDAWVFWVVLLARLLGAQNAMVMGSVPREHTC